MSSILHYSTAFISSAEELKDNILIFFLKIITVFSWNIALPLLCVLHYIIHGYKKCMLTSLFDCFPSRCVVADAETELWLWSKTFAESSVASVLINTTTVLWNRNLSLLNRITRERHPLLLWTLWDNTGHTSTQTCAHKDMHTLA